MSDFPQPLRVLLVARQPLARAGLRGLLAERSEITLCGQSFSLSDAEHLAQELAADALLCDFLPGDLEELSALARGVAAVGRFVVVLGDELTEHDLTALLGAGVRGFLSFDLTGEELGAALQAAGQGLLVLSPLLGKALAASVPAPPPSPSEQEALTEREREVLALLAVGLPNRMIASRLQISEHTVKFHVGSLLNKLGAQSRTEAVTRAVRRGLLAL